MADAIASLVAKRDEFLGFLVRKVGDRALAEDILQDAFTRLDKLEQLRDPEAARAWFYRVLRNAVIDRARREQTRARALHELPAPEVAQETCPCVSTLKDALKPSYRDALEQIELADMPIKDYAAQLGISANSAAVRVFRARNALRDEVEKTCGACADEGCSDCSCARPGR
jgi:RNA polymerase sigma-70 factor (ECF subfamily)